MESTHPTAGWEKVGDRFYRKTQLYTAVFDLDLDLDNYFVAGAPYGGAVGACIMTHHVEELGLALGRRRSQREADIM